MCLLQPRLYHMVVSGVILHSLLLHGLSLRQDFQAEIIMNILSHFQLCKNKVINLENFLLVHASYTLHEVNAISSFG